MVRPRRKTREIQVGNVKIGGKAPVSVQSMTTTNTNDVKATIFQIKQLEAAGCEIIRVAVPDQSSAKALSQIKSQITIPLIADIHFDYQLGLIAIEEGVDCIRLNPGNIGERRKLEKVVLAAKQKEIPIRVGINAGSLERDLLEKYGYPTAEAMVESAVRALNVLEAMEFYNTKVSLKASHVSLAVEAYRLFSSKSDYPLHLGVTEAGTLFTGSIKSAIGLGLLLSEGIGDTIRVSLAADPVEEVRAGFEILKALELRHRGINVIACPTCGRLEIDVIKLANDVEKRLGEIKVPLNISILGCVVNGIGEGMEADVGIAGGRDSGILFKKGEIVRKVNANEIYDVLIEEAISVAREKEEVQRDGKSLDRL
ncbi:MAG: flavodoxin-dependent (E)-4-hydroxy-3-methylbut-2-enyl-diphosphate synthase [Nitrospirae bacterium]|nr:flavodoxin-dependent (E)-4-hydroxy-3-methylbut-2-enyl-diphosphate synthase [Nitrospirota bacterium]MBI3595036.1 flavodoxin-dependent (E)-4-hydroxy-3-methylbut-2-enyl-diphosphate synthase [Nitrospirota bacterium]